MSDQNDHKPCVFCGGLPTVPAQAHGHAVCLLHRDLPLNKVGHACIVGKLSEQSIHPTRPDLVIARIAGHQVVVGDHYQPANPGFHIPVGATVPEKLLREMWLWNDTKGKGRLGGKRGDRVRLREIGDIASDGLFYGAYYFVGAALVQSASWDDAWQIGQDVGELLGITYGD